MKIKNTLLLFLILIIPINAHAYIDPGSGSALTAAILAFFSGIFFYIKKYYYKIKKKFSSIFSFLKK
tara:strand:+ start:777 stop:977 length:201 start_codon:yes stop_codon:yes gene_type:complete